MRRNRRVKIVATLGPASTNEETMRRLFVAGADVFRVNMSHATHDGLREVHTIVRRLETEFSRPIGILVDLQGPKLRIGKIDSGSIRLTQGDILSFVRREAIGGLGRVQLPHPEIFEAVREGHTLLLDDGKLKLRVVEASDVRIDAEVMTTGLLGSRKGISLPDTVLPFGALTDKDCADIECATSIGVAWIALSFVQRAEDIAAARKLSRGRAAIMAKIEKPSAVNHLKEIIELADGIMVARGDLGVEMPLEKVPVAQKTIITKCNRAGKPVITATQMLDSMIRNRRPTRAEVTDVANAVFDGTDATMLSGETAIGKFPVETVQMMRAILLETESALDYSQIMEERVRLPANTVTDAIAQASVSLAWDLSAAAIITPTSSGATARAVSQYRPSAPIIAAPTSAGTYRQLALSWGVIPVLVARSANTDEMIEQAVKGAEDLGIVKQGDTVVLTAGIPSGVPGRTNLIKVQQL